MKLYPYLIAKQQQARILIGCPASGEQAEAAHQALIDLHRRGQSGIDFPAPSSMFEPGWYLRSDIIWSKCNPMPESVRDRPTKAHEYLFLLSKQDRYYYDAEAIAEPLAAATLIRLGQPTLAQQNGSDRVPGKTNGTMKAVGPRFGGNKYGEDDSEQSRTKSGNVFTGDNGRRNARTVWEIATQSYSGAHFATFPEELARRCIAAGCPQNGITLDPFAGSGTVGEVAFRMGRRFVLLDLKYQDLQRERIPPMADTPMITI